MKKSIIVLALALLMVGSVFADTKTEARTPAVSTAIVDTKDADGEVQAVGTSTPLASATDAKKKADTSVFVNLELTPIYYTAITSKDVSSTITKDNYDDATGDNLHVQDIKLNVDKDKLRLLVTNEAPVQTYYVSYFFYENTENVKLTATLSGNLTTTADVGTGDTDSSKYSKEIKYTATIGTDVLNSDGSGTNGKTKAIATVPSTRVLGKATKASLQLIIAPANVADNNIANNVAGYYESTITLNLSTY